MKRNNLFRKPAFWAVFAAVYLVFLLMFVAIYSPDFLHMENCLLFIPLYFFIAIASSMHFKNESDNRKNKLVIASSWLGCTAIVLLFQLLIKGHL